MAFTVIVIPEEASARLEALEEGGDSLDFLQRLVGGLIEALPYPGRDDMTAYVNEEGKFTRLTNVRATRLMAPVLFDGDSINGPLVVCGFDLVGGNLPIPNDVRDELLRDYR